MDQLAVEAFTDEKKRAMFDALGVDPARAVDLGGFESFVFAREDTGTILRVTHATHRLSGQVMAEAAFIAFLAEQGAAVCRPVLGASGELVWQFDDFVVCEFERAGGRLITEDDWGPELFRKWGRALGEMHRLTAEFVPDPEAELRPNWRADENFDFVGRIPEAEVAVLANGEQHLAAFASLPESSVNSGLIHCDAHAGNFHYDPVTGKISFFDFDDCCYCFFGYDIATVLFSAVLQPWIENSDQARVAAARVFLAAFLDGYGKEKVVDELVLAQMPLFLKIREIGLYGVIRTYLDGVTDNDYANKFMAGRRERLEQDAPYFEIDFTRL